MFLRFIQIVGAAIFAGGIGSYINTWLNKDIVLRIGGSQIELLNDYMGATALTTLGVFTIFVTLPFSLTKLKEVFRQRWYLYFLYYIVAAVILLAPAYALFQIDSHNKAFYEAIKNKDLAFFKRSFAAAKFSHETTNNLMLNALSLKSYSILDFLAKNGGDVNAATGSSSFMISNVTYKGDLKAFKIFLNNGLDLDQKESYLGRGILHLIISGKSREKEQIAMLKLLSNKKMNIDEKDNLEETPLMLAAGRGLAGVCTQLLKMGASVNISDKFGRAALHKAVDKSMVYPKVHEQDRLATARVLLKAGADKTLKAGYSGTPLDIAKKAGFAEIVALLKK